MGVLVDVKKGIVAGVLLACSLLAGCDSEPERVEVIDSHGPGTTALLIERAGREGPYVGGTTEHFKVTASGEVFKSVRWSATAGALETDGEQVSWTLPAKGSASLSITVETQSGKTAEGSFNFNVVAAAAVASTAIDPGPDVTGVTCELAFDNAGTGHALYSNDTHRGLWYGTWDGTSWKTEQVDGPGLNNGGTYVWNFALTLDVATGTPHITYLKGPGLPTSPSAPWRITYATRVNGAWIREEVDPANRSPWTRVSVALNPAQGSQPVVVFSDGAAASGIRVATRTAPNTWSIAQFNTAILMGDVTFDASGTLYIPFNPNSGTETYVGTRPGAATDRIRLESVAIDSTQWLAAVWGPSQHLLLVSSDGLDSAKSAFHDLTVATPFTSSTQRGSPLDYRNDASDLAYGAGKPFIAHRHGTTLELITPDAAGFWTYTQLGTVQDGSRPSVAVRPTDGTPHVCYQRDGKVSFQ